MALACLQFSTVKFQVLWWKGVASSLLLRSRPGKKESEQEGPGASFHCSEQVVLQTAPEAFKGVADRRQCTSLTHLCEIGDINLHKGPLIW